MLRFGSGAAEKTEPTSWSVRQTCVPSPHVGQLPVWFFQ